MAITSPLFNPGIIVEAFLLDVLLHLIEAPGPLTRSCSVGGSHV